MGNAMESARVTAKYSTLRNDEDGFAVIMENIISASQEYHASI